MLTKVHIVKVIVFLIVMDGCESWTIKKAECRRIDAFELWCWRRFLRVPWTARRSNQSILKEISPEYSLEGLMLKLKLQYFGHLMGRTDSFKKNPDAGKDWKREEKRMAEDKMVGWVWVKHQLNGQEFEQALGVGEGQGSPGCCSPWGHKESDITEWLKKQIKWGWGTHENENCHLSHLAQETAQTNLQEYAPARWLDSERGWEMYSLSWLTPAKESP